MFPLQTSLCVALRSGSAFPTCPLTVTDPLKRVVTPHASKRGVAIVAGPTSVVGVRMYRAGGQRVISAGRSAVKSGRVFRPDAEEGDALSRSGRRPPVTLRAPIRGLHPEAKLEVGR
jgi:ABC-type Fe3+-hydroxamate transport system substrate-binding protein